MFRLFFESSIQALLSLEMDTDDDSSTLPGSASRRLLMGLASSIAEIKDGEVGGRLSRSSEGLFVRDLSVSRRDREQGLWSSAAFLETTPADPSPGIAVVACLLSRDYLI
jgi:hypothetical protein